MPVTDREERILGIIETARAKRGKFRDERINMAHGAGGKASQSMIEGLFEPAFGAQVTEDAGCTMSDVAFVSGLDESTVSRLWDDPCWLDRVSGRSSTRFALARM